MLKEEVKKFLLKVQKPGRYTGGEVNSIIKDPKTVDVRFAFCFPDVYEVGMSYLGMKILYGLFNREPYIWCERVFAPWPDMEEQMRSNNIKLYGLESGDAITDFDFIGFTLQYELSYTNILNMLNLAGIPLSSKDRKGLNQLVVAGGPCVCNAEPIADFIDIMFLGEGEDIDLKVINLYREFKLKNKTKQEFLKAASKIEGVYIPAFYDISYKEDGTVDKITAKNGAPKTIRKCVIRDMDKSYYPESFVVPSIEIIHDRVAQEIFRGCIRGCRFCQAGYIYRPVREKSPEVISEQCHKLCQKTGYDEISLSSLSSSDYTDIERLLNIVTDWSNDEKINLSLPSLRIDGFSDDITEKLSFIRRSGLTFAPEAATQRLRDVINKNITEEEILNTCSVAFKGGWDRVKLYFMIGLPTETMEDVEGIANLAKKIVDVFYKNRTKGKSLKIAVSVSSFVPKAVTAFQWEAQDSIDTIIQKQERLKSLFNKTRIKLSYHDVYTSFLEAVFARGDRRLSKVLEEAQKRGLHFDGWSEYFNFDEWLKVFEFCKIDPDFYVSRKRDKDEVLPWDHLDYGIKKEFLIEEQRKAYKSLTTDNCRNKCSNCGANFFKGGVCFEAKKNMV